MTPRDPKRLLYVGHTEPWGRMSGSGFSPRICRALQQRGLLYGALQPFQRSLATLEGDGYDRLSSRLLRRLGEKLRLGSDSGPSTQMLAESESDGILPQVLARMEPGSPVFYHFHTPRLDERFRLRRFLFQDLTTRDAHRFGAYGHQRMSEEEARAKIERIRAVMHSEQVAGILTFSTYGADSIASEYGLPRDRVAPIGSGPVRSFWDPRRVERSRYEAARILFVGRSWEKKGGPLLLEAFERVRADLPHASLCIVGPKEQPRDTVGVPGVRFLGQVSDRRVAAAFADASVFCMAPDCETWGIVYVEAANAGLPIVGFDDWALPDIVESGVSGVLVSERGSDALAGALASLLEDPERMLEMGRAARRRVERVLDWPHVVNRLVRMVWPELAQDLQIPSLRDSVH